MDANNILEELQTLYPEDLNKDYNCYWWWTRNTDGSALTYYLLLRDKFMEGEHSADHKWCYIYYYMGR